MKEKLHHGGMSGLLPRFLSVVVETGSLFVFGVSCSFIGSKKEEDEKTETEWLRYLCAVIWQLGFVRANHVLTPDLAF